MAPSRRLVGRAVGVDHGQVDTPLVQGVEPLEELGDLTVDVGHGGRHPLAPVAVATVAELDRLERAGGGARRARWPARTRPSRVRPRPRRSGCRGSRGPPGRLPVRSSSLSASLLLGCAKRYHRPPSADQGILRRPARRRRGRAPPCRLSPAPRPRSGRPTDRDRSAVSGSTPSARAIPTVAKSSSPDLARPGRGPRPRRRPPVASSAPGRPTAGHAVGHPAASSASPGSTIPMAGRLALELGRQRQGRQRGRDPLGHAGPALLGLLEGLPVGGHRRRASSAATSPNTCGWRDTSLSCTPRATSARVNRPSSAARVAWK